MTETLLGDMSSRLFAAMSKWSMPLALWMKVRSLAALSALAGVEPEWPWGDPATAVSDDERAAAEASLRERWGA